MQQSNFNRLLIRRLGALVITLGVFALSKTPLQAAVFNVSDVAGLKAAINKANLAGAGPHIVNLAAGTYTLTIVDNFGSFSKPFGLPGMMNEITIQGAGASSTIIERAPGSPDFAIFDLRQNFGPFTLNDVTIRNGRQTTADGGAVFHIGNDLIVNNVVFDNNVTGGGGGAIVGLNGAPMTISNSVFTNNSASHTGGAINGRPIVSNSRFENNTAADGGAIACDFFGCQVTVTDGRFMNNIASQTGGGAIAVFQGAASITSGLFTGNRATSAFGVGGAVAIGSGSSAILDSLFVDNSAGSEGGAINACSGGCGTNLAITGATFQGNAGFNGGAINGEATTIRNSTFSGNTAQGEGGAVRLNQGAIVLNNVTVTGNTAAGNAGGLRSTVPVTMRNTIIASNTNGSGFSPDCWSVVNSQGHNLIGDSASCSVASASGDQIGSAASPIDPMLQALAPNSGKTAGANVGGQAPQVIPTHALLLGSPAIDAGDPGTPGAGGTACEATDQRGVARPVDLFCDIGAFEGTVSTAVVIEIAESITVSDTPALLPAAMISVNESIIVADAPAIVPAAMINIAEVITVADAPTLLLPTATVLASSANPSVFGLPVTFTATVTSGSNAVTQGSVTFKEGATALSGPATLNAAGQASFTTSTLSGGSHVITAQYNGGANFLPSSASLTQTVLNTAPGNNVAVTPLDPPTGLSPATVTFATVNVGGQTTLVIGTSAPAPAPRGFKPGSPQTYYDLSTTAVFSGTVKVCIDYSGINFQNEALTKLFHFENGAWVDGTISLNTQTNIICGNFTSLSPFAVFELAARPVIAVANQNDDMISVIDPETNQVARNVEVGHKPDSASFFDVFIDAFTAPAKLYVSQRKSEATKGKDDEDGDGQGSIEILVGPASPTPANALDFSAVKTIEVGNRPEGLAVRPDGSQIWVANRNDDSISIIDRATEKVIATVPLKKKAASKGKGSQESKIGEKPVAIGFSSDGQYAYVAGRNSNKLIVLDAVNAAASPANAILGHVQVGNKPVALALNHSAGLVYVANRSGNEVAVVEVSDPAMPLLKARRAVGEEPEGVALLPDASKLYVTNSESDSVSVLQVQEAPAYLVPIKTIAVGKKPSGIALTPAGTFDNQPYAYVANREDNTVSVIDTTTDQVIAVIPVGKGPKGVAAGLVPTAP